MKQRIELNTHSTYDTMNSVLTLEDMIEFAYDNEMPALALTDLNCVQGFSKFSEYCDRAVIKPIFGAQIIHGDSDSGYPFISTVLVKNQTGLKNLYKIISALKDDGVCKNVPIEVLEEYHEGLLYGSAGHGGGLYRTLISEDFEGYKSFLKFYDYYEIESFYNTLKEKEANKIIVTMAKGLKKPVVAVSGARYIDKNDAVCLDILNGRNKRKENRNNMHFRTTEEMLQEFSYLGEEREEAVINNTHKIADMIEKVENC